MRMHLSLLLAASLSFAAPAAWSDTAYPDKPIRMIVPYSPGGATDTVARLLSQKMSESMGQSVVVDNRPGAGGIIGTEAVARAEPDGYTLLLNTAGAQTLSPVIYKTNFDALKSFAPVSLLANIGFVVVVNPERPIHSMAELIKQAKEGSGSVSFSAGSSMITLIGEQFKSVIDAPDMLSVPYKGTGPQLTAVLGGEVDMTFDPFNSIQMIKAGKLRPLAVLSKNRSPALPDVPTMQEAGVKDMVFNSWAALLAPAGTPEPIIERLHSEVLKALNDPVVRNQFAAIDYELVGSTPQELASTITDDVARWTRIVEQSGYKVTP